MPPLDKELREKWFHGEPNYRITLKGKGRNAVNVKPIKLKSQRGKKYASGNLLGWIKLEETRGKRGKKVYFQPPDKVRMAASQLARCVRDQVRAWEWPELKKGEGPFQMEMKLKIKKPY